MKILIIDQCSSAKKSKNRNSPLTEEVIDTRSLSQLLEQGGVPSYPARELYQGRQQEFITEAVALLRNTNNSVDRVFISAGFGVVDEDDELPLYDVAFSEMSASEIDERTEKLGINMNLRDLIAEDDYDLVFMPLGNDYYRSADLDSLLPTIPMDTNVVLFNQEEREIEHENVISLSARTDEARDNGTIVIALKGEYIWNFMTHLKAGTSIENLEDIRDYCREGTERQSGMDVF